MFFKGNRAPTKHIY